jgi:hypothetical protein
MLQDVEIKTTILLELPLSDREVGGSNPFAPTIKFKNFQPSALAAVFRLGID